MCSNQRFNLKKQIKGTIFVKLTMDNLKYLLKELNILRQRIIDREKNQDTFNIFEFMFKKTDEVNLHSRFLSVLMDPTASHKMGDLFIGLFIERMGTDFVYDLSSLETYPNENSRSEYHEIDLLLIDRKYKSAIILENKIRHHDSNHDTEGQLERYYRRIIQEEGIPAASICVVYLSVDRDAPSDDSVGKSGLFPELKDKIININYGSEILDWLRMCVKECYDRPYLRECISQYIKLIEKMTNNDTSEDDIESIIKLVGKNSDNLMSAKLLINNYRHLYWYAIYWFWKELTEEFIQRGYEIRRRIENEEITNLVHGGQQKRKVNFNLEISSPSGINMTVNSDYNAYICIGRSGESKKDYKYVDFGSSAGPVLSNFNNDETFALLSESNRAKTVKTIAEQTDSLIEDFSNFE